VVVVRHDDDEFASYQISPAAAGGVTPNEASSKGIQATTAAAPDARR
jgi:hypothetical protein